jgi:hypothetical protein
MCRAFTKRRAARGGPQAAPVLYTSERAACHLGGGVALVLHITRGALAGEGAVPCGPCTLALHVITPAGADCWRARRKGFFGFCDFGKTKNRHLAAAAAAGTAGFPRRHSSSAAGIHSLQQLGGGVVGPPGLGSLWLAAARFVQRASRKRTSRCLVRGIGPGQAGPIGSRHGLGHGLLHSKGRRAAGRRAPPCALFSCCGAACAGGAAKRLSSVVLWWCGAAPPPPGPAGQHPGARPACRLAVRQALLPAGNCPGAARGAAWVESPRGRLRWRAKSNHYNAPARVLAEARSACGYIHSAWWPASGRVAAFSGCFPRPAPRRAPTRPPPGQRPRRALHLLSPGLCTGISRMRSARVWRARRAAGLHCTSIWLEVLRDKCWGSLGPGLPWASVCVVMSVALLVASTNSFVT